VERTKYGVGLRTKIAVGGCGPRHAAQSRSTHTASDFPAGNQRERRCRGSRLRWRRWIGDIFEALDIGTAGGPKLRFDPAYRGLISIGALLPVAKLSQTLDDGLVGFQIQPSDQRLDGIVDQSGLCLCGDPCTP